MPAWLESALARLAGDDWLQGLVAALATLVLEDPTTVGCGLLVADGRMRFLAAFLGVAAGIVIGDVGLYAIGRLCGPRLVRWGFVSEARFDRAGGWFNRNLVAAVLLSRFLPGMRLPTYVGAGILRAPMHRFVAVAAGASVVWTLALLWLTARIGEAVLPLLGQFKWPAALALIGVVFWLQRRAARRIVRAAPPSAAPVASSFEFWPPWLFYVPVALYYLCLAVRHRGARLPTLANPSIFSGGMIGESKSAILDLVPEPHRRSIAPYVVFCRPPAERPLDEVALAARATFVAEGLDYPLVAKPDVGQRGAGVQLLRGDGDLRAYLRGFPPGERLMFQRLAGGDDARPIEETITDGIPERLAGAREAGVLYWRIPGATEGKIFSITLKLFPSVTGDGRLTLRELIEKDPRARYVASIYLDRHAADADRVLAPGERRRLVFAGNHCQGAIFRDGTALATPALLARIHAIGSAMPEFYFGRFDIRFDRLAACLKGEDLQIIEINGAGAEATHIWDGSARLVDAYRTLFQQFRILFSIGAANRGRGHRPLGFSRLLREALAYRRLARSYPATH